MDFVYSQKTESRSFLTLVPDADVVIIVMVHFCCFCCRFGVMQEELCWAHVAETEAIVDHADNQWKLKVNLTTE